MKILQIVKTSDGANWAVLQVTELVRLGVDVHVALPQSAGRQIDAWQRSGATIHISALDLPVKSPWRYPQACRAARELVSRVKPDLIHSHFVGTTLLLRRALGKSHPIPRIFQVPGPLHLEHWLYRQAELATASPSDHWIASSRYIHSLYEKSGIDPQRLFVSYYGTKCDSFESFRTGFLRQHLGIQKDALIVGNMNYMYPPKYYLGQRVGLKCHEDIIRSLALAIQKESRLVGVLVGGAWGKQHWYEERLRKMAHSLAGNRIIMPGFMNHEDVQRAWADFDLIVHSPLSENCGGVHEAMIAGVPVVAGRVGGLPELVIDGFSGMTVPNRDPVRLSQEILIALRDLEARRAMAGNGMSLVRRMFNVERTAAEIRDVYRHVLNQKYPRPLVFDAGSEVKKIGTTVTERVAC
ncbi:MAG TPA: glycosyltransferase family 4 protein [Schlesneria sp.]|jgi:glycosyltransferase involved in cell wall biosynthesis